MALLAVSKSYNNNIEVLYFRAPWVIAARAASAILNVCSDARLGRQVDVDVDACVGKRAEA